MLCIIALTDTDTKLSQSEEKMTFLSSLAETLGCSEEGSRLILGQLLGYPVILVYRWIVANQRPTIQHLYFIITGQIALVIRKVNH